MVIAVNKSDLAPLEGDPSEEELRALAVESGAVSLLSMSTATGTGVATVKDAACSALASQRDARLAGARAAEHVARRIYVAQPASIDPHAPAVQLEIPQSVFVARARKEADDDDEEEHQETELERQWAEGGPGVYSASMRRHWIVGDEDWRHDEIPEIVDGMNVMDFIDPDVSHALCAVGGWWCLIL